MSEEARKDLATWLESPSAAPDEPSARLVAAAALGVRTSAGPPPAYASLQGAQRDAARQRDAAVKRLAGARLKTHPDYAQLLETFRNSPVTGMTTLIDLARQKVGYNPLATGDGPKLTMFMVEIMSCPLFTFSSSSDHFEFDPAKPEGSPEAVIKRFIGDDPVAGPPLQRSLNAVFQRAAENWGATQSEDLVREYRFDVDSRYRFVISGSSVTVVVIMMPGPRFITQAKGSRGAYEFAFNAQEWPKYAEATLDRHLKSTDDWLAENTNLR